MLDLLMLTLLLTAFAAAGCYVVACVKLTRIAPLPKRDPQ